MEYLEYIERGIQQQVKNNLVFLTYWNDILTNEILSLEQVAEIKSKIYFDRLLGEVEIPHEEVLHHFLDSICPEYIVNERGLEPVENSLINSLSGARQYRYNQGRWHCEVMYF